MPFLTVAARAVVAVRAYRALCRKHLAPPRGESLKPCPQHFTCRNLTQEHRDDLHHPAAGRP